MENIRDAAFFFSSVIILTFLLARHGENTTSFYSSLKPVLIIIFQKCSRISAWGIRRHHFSSVLIIKTLKSVF